MKMINKLLLLFLILLPMACFGSRTKIEKDELWVGEGTDQNYSFYFDIGLGTAGNPYMTYDSTDDIIGFSAFQAESTTIPSRPASIMTQGEIDATTPREGDQAYNSTTKKLNIWIVTGKPIMSSVES